MQRDAIGLVGENTAQRFVQSQLDVGSCYKIEKYSCSETPRYSRILQNPINLNVGPASMITPVEDTEEIPTSWFHFETAEGLSAFTEPPEFCPGLPLKSYSYKKSLQYPFPTYLIFVNSFQTLLVLTESKVLEGSKMVIRFCI